MQLKQNNRVHVLTLEGQKPSTTLEYVYNCVKFIEVFSERYKDMKCKLMESNNFVNLFNVKPADLPVDLQHKICLLQSDDEVQQPPIA